MVHVSTQVFSRNIALENLSTLEASTNLSFAAIVKVKLQTLLTCLVINFSQHMISCYNVVYANKSSVAYHLNSFLKKLKSSNAKLM